MENPSVGILTSIDWNSNGWKKFPTQEDIDTSNFKYVQDSKITQTFLNFGHNDFPADDNGYFWGNFPQLWSKTPQVKNIEIILIKAVNWKDKNNYIIGMYVFPIFKKDTNLPSGIPEMKTREVNVGAFPKDIHLLENYVQLTSENKGKFLPKGKDLGMQGFNYLTKENVLRILDEMTLLNPQDKKLSNIKLRLIQTLNKKVSFVR
ncbi:MAG: hypothetical protein KIT62_12775 [Cyclobacteriaceae bacterium]|nr:hypothetical protein [Cyclobacteriaceae bacterium]